MGEGRLIKNRCQEKIKEKMSIKYKQLRNKKQENKKSII